MTVSVSCFVPKAHTPFQWFVQDSLAEFERKQQLLKDNIRDRSIQFKYHDARTSYLEGAISRGDRRLAKVIYQAWLDGAKFDGWSDQFKYEVWLEAFHKCSINPEDYSQRERSFTEHLPWEHVSPGVNKEFFLREYKKACQQELTEDCRRGRCSACGVCPNLEAAVVDGGKKYE